MNKLVKLTIRLLVWGGLLVLFAACSDGNAPPAVQPGVAVLGSPARLADIDASTLLVTDYATGLFQRIDKATLLPQLSLHLPGQATGIAEAGGRYYIGNRATRSVDVLDAQGRFLYHLGGRTGEFAAVNDLAVDIAAGVVYVLDTKSALVRLFYLDGTDTGVTIGAGILQRPTALAIDEATDTLLVSDFGDPATGAVPSIWIFNPGGVQIDVIRGVVRSGMLGSTAYFSTPQGLCVDSGHVFVVDALAGEVQVFSLAAGHPRLLVLGQLGTGDGDLFYPLDVAVDTVTKDVFVADNRNGRIAVFRAGGVLP